MFDWDTIARISRYYRLGIRLFTSAKKQYNQGDNLSKEITYEIRISANKT